MNIEGLLRGVPNCTCKKSHLCPIKEVVIGSGATENLPRITQGYSRILLVADENTYAVGGKFVEGRISDKISGRIIFPGKDVLVPDENAIEKIKAQITKDTDLVLGIGSGVVNDLCKYVSFISGLSYFIVATAPSMDGYASAGAALILGGMKVTLNAAVPEAIIADTDILRTAPMDMILAGYGDIIGKYSCLSDWKLSSIVNGEYLCDFVLSATYEEVEKTRKLAKKLSSRNPEAIETLMQALVAVGILMAYVGNSRPASGSEHHFSHYFEIVGIVKGEKYLPHGIDVFYSAAETAKIREELLSLCIDDIYATDFDIQKYKQDVCRIYGSVGEEVIALQNKLGWYNEIDKRISVYREKFDQIKAVLRDAPSFDEMCGMISEVGMSYSDFTSFYGEPKIRDAYLYAKDLKDRYTVLWMYSDLVDAIKAKNSKKTDLN